MTTPAAGGLAGAVGAAAGAAAAGVITGGAGWIGPALADLLQIFMRVGGPEKVAELFANHGLDQSTLTAKIAAEKLLLPQEGGPL